MIHFLNRSHGPATNLPGRLNHTIEPWLQNFKKRTDSLRPTPVPELASTTRIAQDGHCPMDRLGPRFA
jgi:hypothetical protein